MASSSAGVKRAPDETLSSLEAPCPSLSCPVMRAGAESQGIDVVAAETIMRRLFPTLPPLRFQGLMRVMCHEVLGHIQDCHPSRQAHHAC